MIDAASEHNQADPLACLYSITCAEPANYSPRQVSGHLHQGEGAARSVGHRDQVAFVVLAGVVAKGGAAGNSIVPFKPPSGFAPPFESPPHSSASLLHPVKE